MRMQLSQVDALFQVTWQLHAQIDVTSERDQMRNGIKSVESMTLWEMLKAIQNLINLFFMKLFPWWIPHYPVY